MKILALETSSKYLSLAVGQDNKVLAQTHRLLDRKHSLQLVPLIDKILRKVKVRLKEIDGFCVGKGPGSFTGLRIGITTIKGLAFVLAKPVVAIPSLDILAQNAQEIVPGRNKTQGARICPIIDAKQNKVYTCLYQIQDSLIKRKSRYMLLSITELLRKLKGEVFFLGDAILLYREEIYQHNSIKPYFAEERFWYPQASRTVTLALERFQKGNTDDVNSLTPLYLYPKTCQI